MIARPKLVSRFDAHVAISLHYARLGVHDGAVCRQHVIAILDKYTVGPNDFTGRLIIISTSFRRPRNDLAQRLDDPGLGFSGRWFIGSGPEGKQRNGTD